MRNVGFTYENAARPALHDVTFSLQRGLVYGVVGLNGSGKSTLCSLMRGIIPHFLSGDLTGEIEILGHPLDTWDPGELSLSIGYVFQNPFTQISGIRETVFEEIAFGLENTGVDRTEIFRRTAAIIDELGLGDIAGKNPNQLSGGQRQKVAFASVLVMHAELMVIDEPTAQLDPETSEAIFSIIRGLKTQGVSVVLVEHKIDLLAEYTDRILVMHEGTVVMEGPTALVLGGPATAFDVPRPEAAELASLMIAAGETIEPIPVSEDAALSAFSPFVGRVR
jgi:energy-coupling factor transport system ATP-binding protein